MAITRRYFSTAAAGAGDGTSWANRAQLVNGATWSTVITGFDFTSDSLECLIGPGTHTPTATFQTSLFTSTAPGNANKLLWHGCDSSGNQLSPPDPDWTSDMPDFDVSVFPRIDTTTNIVTITAGVALCRCINFTASGRNGVVISSTGTVGDWIRILNSTANTAAACSDQVRMDNSICECSSATGFSRIWGGQTNNRCENLKLKGNASAAGGNRRGFQSSTASVSTSHCTRLTIINTVTGIYLESSSVNSSTQHCFKKCTIVGPSGDGIFNEDGSAAGLLVEDCVIVNCGGYGINVNSGCVQGIFNNRMRDNTSGNVGNAGNAPQYDSYTTDSDDTEFNNAAGGDYRIRAGLPWSNRGIGVSQMPPTVAAA